MTSISRRGFLGVTGALGLAGLVGCAATSNTPNKGTSGTQDLTLGLTYIPNVQFAPFYVAVEKGLFAAQGLNVTIRHHGAQEDLFGALISGREQVVCASSDEAVVATSQGEVTIATFATMYQKHPVCIITRADQQVSSMKDLAGKRVGLPGRSGSTYYGLRTALHGAGMTESDIVLMEIGYTSIAALSSDKVDAIVGFLNNEPLILKDKGLEVKVLEVTDQNEPSLVGPGLMTKKDSLSPELLGKLAAALLESEKAIVADPAAALEVVVGQVPDLGDPTARAGAEKILAATSELWMRDGSPTVKVNQAAFQRMTQFLADSGIAKRRVDPSEVAVAS